MTRSLKLGGAGALVLLLALAATWTVRPLDGENRTFEVTGAIEALQVDVSARITARIKGVGFEDLWSNVLPLVAFGAVVFSLSILRFRKQLD